MNLDTAKTEVADMYRAHGREAPDGVVARLAFAMTEAKCGPCAIESVREAADSGAKPLTVPAFREALGARMEKPEHWPHVSMSTTEARVADEETFWRTTGADSIRTAAQIEPDEARFLAAKMWASGAVPAEPSQIAEEFTSLTWDGAVWRALLVGPVDVEVAFTSARVDRSREVA